MTAKVFEAALGIGAPWSVGAVEFDEATKVLTVPVDFKPGTRFKVSGQKGLHPVHDTVVKTYRHLNFFQHECYLKVRTPRVKLGDGSVRLVEPDFAGRLSGFTLLFEALVLMLSQQMPFAAVARIVGESAYRCMQVCNRYVEMALEQADFSDVTSLAIDETSRARGHDYVTLAADAQARRVIFVTEGRDAKAVKALAADLAAHGCPPEQITSVSIDMSPAFIKGVSDQLPNAQITFDKFHVVGHANAAVNKTRRIEQRTEKSLKGMRWTLLKDVFSLKATAGAALHGLITAPKLTRTARAWLYKEQLREALDRKQINVMREMLKHWCVCVMRSKVEAMKEVAALVRRHMDGIVAWAQTRQTNGFLEAINGLFQSAKRRARGFKRLSTIKTVIFLIAGKLDFQTFNPHARQPT
ncbi:ISL3-like element ISXoo13 family transposase [Xanthomonas oryzae]|uniref:ISL3-like element ISXoo13 family transposase n=1 Tax=Xanthomonas oryzae TaxID=347 RepID=UPI0000679025|nr:ISL3-like element ISXoo13 family transposase [Xanthomonas oryzae]AOS02652.1 transposase [Xanthomonas oryzae pv. oryzae]AOS15436.1 transposase [Xanthomonas oryzae pv. oryzae]AOS19297.1 transposase [Xanthomonas oryzae pv. oryzae]AOS23452.1 transposase [Xanthomonas oryzae pv. oryzae]AOS27585.1 transposase [Xanthomonas oryzae pv. oryzae]